MTPGPTETMTTPRRHILCAGGCGFIGSHTVVHLLENNYDVTVIDSLANACLEVLRRLEEITKTTIKFAKVDIADETAVKAFLKEACDKNGGVCPFDGVIHYAALKAVGESVAKPLAYYGNNVSGTVTFLKCLGEVGCKVFVFSSSATVYAPKEEPITESDVLGPSNPYGWTKYMNEEILQDLYKADPEWRISILRYFNPVGAHPSGRIGESPDYPNNLLPFIQQVAVGRRSCLHVFGNDWPTRDGTGVRDYLHVEDLAIGHVRALDKLFGTQPPKGCLDIHNLGTGSGVSVLEMAKMFEEASGVPIPVEIAPRRPGDLSTVIADPSKANKELKWQATRTIKQACESAWKWQSSNPYGYCQPPAS